MVGVSVDRCTKISPKSILNVKEKICFVTNKISTKMPFLSTNIPHSLRISSLLHSYVRLTNDKVCFSVVSFYSMHDFSFATAFLLDCLCTNGIRWPFLEKFHSKSDKCKAKQTSKRCNAIEKVFLASPSFIFNSSSFFASTRGKRIAELRSKCSSSAFHVSI